MGLTRKPLGTYGALSPATFWSSVSYSRSWSTFCNVCISCDYKNHPINGVVDGKRNSLLDSCVLKHCSYLVSEVCFEWTDLVASCIAGVVMQGWQFFKVGVMFVRPCPLIQLCSGRPLRTIFNLLHWVKETTLSGANHLSHLLPTMCWGHHRQSP